MWKKSTRRISKKVSFEIDFGEIKIILALTAGHWAKSEVLQRHGANIPRQKNYYAWRTGTEKKSFSSKFFVKIFEIKKIFENF